MQGAESLILLVLFGLVFYLLLIRPQRTRMRQLQQVRAQLRPGTEIVTTAGMYARVAAVDDTNDTVLLEFAPGVTARFLKAAVGQIVPVAGEGTGSSSAGPGARPVDEPGEPGRGPEDRPPA